VLEFDTGIFGCEVPIGFGVVAVAVALPSGDFRDESLPSCASSKLKGKRIA